MQVDLVSQGTLIGRIRAAGYGLRGRSRAASRGRTALPRGPDEVYWIGAIGGSGRNGPASVVA